jgi:predicted nucleic-acid-binding Zn-ribbon protein
MPTKEGKLPLKERQCTKSHLTSMMKNTACPICTSSNWTLSDILVTPTTLKAGGGFAIGDPVFPQVMLVSECGYTRYFSGTPLGLVC